MCGGIGFSLKRGDWKKVWSSWKDNKVSKQIIASLSREGNEGRKKAYQNLRIGIAVTWLGCVCLSWGAWLKINAPFPKWFIYLSHQGAFLELVYFCFAAITTVSACKSGTGGVTPWYATCTWVLSEVVPVLAIIITVGFWIPIILGMSTLQVDELARSLHGANLCWLVLDGVVCKRPPFQKRHMLVPIIYVIGYVSFSYIYFINGGTDWQGNRYIYNFMDWDNNPQGVAVVAALLSFIVVPLLYLAYGCLVSDKIQECVGEVLVTRA